MLRLQNVNQSLEISLAAPVAVNELHVVVTYSDEVGNQYTGGLVRSITVGTTHVTICPAPAAGVGRDIETINVRNRDGSSVTATVWLNDNGTLVDQHAADIDSGGKLTYAHTIEWRVYNSDGSVKSGSVQDLSPYLRIDDAVDIYVPLTSIDTDVTLGANSDALIASQKATKSFVQTSITAAVNALLNGAPGALDTLKELADALNDDANFAATVTTALAGKQPLDSDLTALAALTTTAFGRSLLELANSAALRTAGGLVIGTDVQAQLVSGTNLKTINSISLLGAGDIPIVSAPGGSSLTLQGNVSGAFAAVPNWAFDATTGKLTWAIGAITASSPHRAITATLNAGGVTFDMSTVNLTKTAAATGSTFERWQVGGNDRYHFDIDGRATITYNTAIYTSGLKLVESSNSGNFSTLSSDTLNMRGSWAQMFVTTGNDGVLNMGGGVAYFRNIGTRAALQSYVNLELQPGALGGGGTYVEINGGTQGSCLDMRLRGVRFATTWTVGTLPSAATAGDGMTYRVTDLNAPALGAAPAGSGSTKGLVTSNGSSYTVTQFG